MPPPPITSTQPPKAPSLTFPPGRSVSSQTTATTGTKRKGKKRQANEISEANGGEEQNGVGTNGNEREPKRRMTAKERKEAAKTPQQREESEERRRRKWSKTSGITGCSDQARTEATRTYLQQLGGRPQYSWMNEPTPQPTPRRPEAPGVVASSAAEKAARKTTQRKSPKKTAVRKRAVQKAADINGAHNVQQVPGASGSPTLTKHIVGRGSKDTKTGTSVAIAASPSSVLDAPVLERNRAEESTRAAVARAMPQASIPTPSENVQAVTAEEIALGAAFEEAHFGSDDEGVQGETGSGAGAGSRLPTPTPQSNQDTSEDAVDDSWMKELFGDEDDDNAGVQEGTGSGAGAGSQSPTPPPQSNNQATEEDAEESLFGDGDDGSLDNILDDFFGAGPDADGASQSPARPPQDATEEDAMEDLFGPEDDHAGAQEESEFGAGAESDMPTPPENHQMDEGDAQDVAFIEESFSNDMDDGALDDLLESFYGAGSSTGAGSRPSSPPPHSDQHAVEHDAQDDEWINESFDLGNDDAVADLLAGFGETEEAGSAVGAGSSSPTPPEHNEAVDKATRHVGFVEAMTSCEIDEEIIEALEGFLDEALQAKYKLPPLPKNRPSDLSPEDARFIMSLWDPKADQSVILPRFLEINGVKSTGAFPGLKGMPSYRIIRGSSVEDRR
ncbi:hypothetical protein SLS62_002103 [Diatrype stigma]|uniref:Uncharacterized protein n=1 Tax=Diatrype stigma TaxID=117547 RepID=A0AAN9UX05_9PEZI